jgi:hypothetical protein
MGLSLYGAIHLVIIIDKFNNRMDRFSDKYGNAVDATTSGSACEGTLDHLKFDNDRNNCPTNEPCHDYCKNYFDAFNARHWAILGTIFLIGAFASGAVILFTPEGLNFIENFRNFISNCRGEPNESGTYEYREGESPFNSGEDEQCPITHEYIKDLTNPVVARDGYIYERDAIERWLALHHTSPMTNFRMGKTLIPYKHNQESADSQQQTVSALRTLSYTSPLVVHTGSGDENEGNENTFTV